MRTTSPVLLCAILLLSCIPISEVGADSVEVCCDSGPVELFLIGPADSGGMTPFESLLGTESQEVTISDSIPQERDIATWSINPAWTGSYPSSTWEFAIDYEVANAGGVQINATVTVEIGGSDYEGVTDQSNSFLAAGAGTFSIDVNVESGSIPASTAISVTLTAQTVVFSVPGADAGLTFRWGGEGDESSIKADLPVVDLLIDEPVTEGMDVYVSMVVASPFGQLAAVQASSLDISVNGGILSGDPIETSSGDYVRLTWTWRATTPGEQTITIGASIQIQSGTPLLSGSSEFTIDPFDDGSSSGGVFYPTEEPLRTDGAGSPLTVGINMFFDKSGKEITLEKEFKLTMDDEISYWMRWGMDNIGNDDPALSQPLRIFSSGMVSEEDTRNRIIDSVEINEFESQMVNLGTTYMNEGMALELEELIGTDVRKPSLQISFELDLHGENRVTPHPLTLKISTSEIVEQNEVNDILRDFIVVQPAPIWANIDISITIETSMMVSLTGATIKGEDSIELTHRRTPFGETISIKAENLEPSATFTLSGMPTANPLNAPLSLSIITLVIIGGGLYLSLRITKNKRRSALWIETILIPVVLLSLYLAYDPFTVGIIAGITVAIWFITAIASPNRKGAGLFMDDSNYPTIQCPACGTTNSIMTDERPFRMACSGCKRVLKIVE
tara:strand:- start:49567 stop:51588 length:2022 start_codon:yes stop_codon:yes gene_type:complete